MPDSPQDDSSVAKGLNRREKCIFFWPPAAATARRSPECDCFVMSDAPVRERYSPALAREASSHHWQDFQHDGASSGVDYRLNHAPNIGPEWFQTILQTALAGERILTVLPDAYVEGEGALPADTLTTNCNADRDVYPTQLVVDLSCQKLASHWSEASCHMEYDSL